MKSLPAADVHSEMRQLTDATRPLIERHGMTIKDVRQLATANGAQRNLSRAARRPPLPAPSSLSKVDIRSWQPLEGRTGTGDGRRLLMLSRSLSANDAGADCGAQAVRYDAVLGCSRSVDRPTDDNGAHLAAATATALCSGPVAREYARSTTAVTRSVSTADDSNCGIGSLVGGAGNDQAEVDGCRHCWHFANGKVAHGAQKPAASGDACQHQTCRQPLHLRPHNKNHQDQQQQQPRHSHNENGESDQPADRGIGARPSDNDNEVPVAAVAVNSCCCASRQRMETWIRKRARKMRNICRRAESLAASYRLSNGADDDALPPTGQNRVGTPLADSSGSADRSDSRGAGRQLIEADPATVNASLDNRREPQANDDDGIGDNLSSGSACAASAEMRNKAYKICREFLSGSWKSISSNDMIFKTVSGGLSNLLYYCSLPETHTPLRGEPSQVLMRMYGQIHGDQDTSTITESIICTLLSERAIGPKLFGVFPGGRLEEYIPARALLTEQIRQPEISLSISRKLARLHALQAPLNKEPVWFFDNMEKWLKVREEIEISSVPVETRKHAEKLMNFDYRSEMSWLRKIFKNAHSPIMFCHNDLQEGNILQWHNDEAAESSPDDNLVFIDFEYCAYNYRGFDIANHFCEWTYDYSHPEYPLFKETPEDYPNETQKLAFLQEYLTALKSTSVNEAIDPNLNTLEHLLDEVQIFTLATHIMWSLWSLNSARSSKINFGYWEYGAARLTRYLEHKRDLKTRINMED